MALGDSIEFSFLDANDYTLEQLSAIWGLHQRYPQEMAARTAEMDAQNEPDERRWKFVQWMQEHGHYDEWTA